MSSIKPRDRIPSSEDTENYRNRDLEEVCSFRNWGTEIIAANFDQTAPGGLSQVFSLNTIFVAVFSVLILVSGITGVVSAQEGDSPMVIVSTTINGGDNDNTIDPGEQLRVVVETNLVKQVKLMEDDGALWTSSHDRIAEKRAIQTSSTDTDRIGKVVFEISYSDLHDSREKLFDNTEDDFKILAKTETLILDAHTRTIGRYELGEGDPEPDGSSNSNNDASGEENTLPEASFHLESERPNPDETILFDPASSSDPDGEDAFLEYEWDWDNDGNFEEKTGTVTSHSFDDESDQRVTLRVTDENGGTDTVTKTIDMNELPDAQFDIAEDNLQVPRSQNGKEVTFDAAKSSDSDSEIQSFEWRIEGDGTTFEESGEEATRRLLPGTYDVTLVVTDEDGGRDSTTQTITVNGPPEVNLESSMSTVDEGRSFSLRASASDPNDDSLSYEWEQTGGPNIPESALPDGDLGPITAPEVSSETEELQFRVIVRDGNDRVATDSVSVTVSNVDNPPTVDAGGPYSVSEEGTTKIEANTNDDEGFRNRALSVVDGPGSITDGGTYQAPDDLSSDTTATVKLEATDSSGQTAEDTARIEISEENDEPTAEVEGDYTVNAGETITLTGSGSDEEGSIAKSWSLESGPGSISGNTYSAPDSVSGDTSATVELTVTDEDDASATETATVNIQNVNTPPTAQDVSVSTKEGETVSGSFDADDPDDDSLAYSIKSGPDHGSVYRSGEDFRFDPASDFTGTASFTYEVSDGNGGTDTGSVSVSVTESNDANSDGTDTDTSESDGGESTENAHFTVSTIRTNAPITAGEILEVTVDVENSGDEFTTQTITLDVGDQDSADSTTTTLDSGETKTVTLRHYTDGTETGERTVVVSSYNDSAETTVELRDTDSTDSGDGTEDNSSEKQNDGNDSDETNASDEKGENSEGASETGTIEVTDLQSNAPVRAGEQLEVTADIENTGDALTTQTVTLDIGDESDVDSTTVTLRSGDTQTVTLQSVTDDSDVGDHNVIVSSYNDSLETNVVVQEASQNDENTTVEDDSGGENSQNETTAGETDRSVNGSSADETDNQSSRSEDNDASERSSGDSSSVNIERITPVGRETTVAPGAELFFEVVASNYSDRGIVTEWIIDGETHSPLGPYHGEYRNNATPMDFYRVQFNETGVHDVRVVVYSQDRESELGSVEWTVNVEQGAPGSINSERVGPNKSAVTVDGSDTLNFTVGATDQNGELHRVIWWSTQCDALLGSTSINGTRDTATEMHTVSYGCGVWAWVVNERGIITRTTHWTTSLPNNDSQAEENQPTDDGQAEDGEPTDDDQNVQQTKTIEIVSTGGDRGFYEFTVSGELEFGENANPVNAEYPDQIDLKTGSGSVAGGTDDFEFTGSVEDIAVEGPVEVYVNGEQIDVQQGDLGPEADGRSETPEDEQPMSEIRIVSTGGDRGFYEFSVSGELEVGENANPVNAEYPDEVDGQTGSGSVAGGSDNFQFTGSVEDITVDGPIEVYVDGEQIDVQQGDLGPGTDGATSDDGSETLPNEIRIVSTSGDRAFYEFTVSDKVLLGENANPVNAEYPDEIDGKTGSGSVAGGADNFHFSGNVEDIKVDGPVEVYVNGQQINVQQGDVGPDTDEVHFHRFTESPAETVVSLPRRQNSTISKARGIL